MGTKGGLKKLMKAIMKMAFVEGGNAFGIPSSITSSLNELWSKPP